MNALVRKEIRSLLPVWIIAIILAMVPCWLPGYGLACATIGALLLSLAPFGQEFSAGTFQQFLSQPVSREQLWRTKVVALFVAALSIFAIGIISNLIGIVLHEYSLTSILNLQIHGFTSYRLQEHLALFTATAACLAMAAFASGLWTTILFRQMAAAFWFGLLVPLLIGAATLALAQRVFRTPPESHVPESWALATLVLYSIAAYYLARRMFLRAQDTQWTGGTISMGNWFRAKTETRSEASTRKPFRALLRKEFQLQQASLLLAGLLAILHLGEIGLGRFAADPSHHKEMYWQVIALFWLLWFGLPFVIGSTAVAEERKYGIHECQQCLPATRLVQFAIKIGLVLLLGTFVGGLMPWLLQSFGVLVGSPGEFPRLGDPDSGVYLGIFLLSSFGITFVSFYASTLTRNILQAMGAAVLLIAVLGTFSGWVLSGGALGVENLSLWSGKLPIIIGVPTLLILMLFLGFRNYKSLLVGSSLWVVRNGAPMLAGLFFVVVAATFLYNRAWELVLSPEPKHGLPKLNGPIRPQVFSVGGRGFKTTDDKTVITSRVFALLPDGRLWASLTNRLVKGFKMDVGNRDFRDTYLPAPEAGIFVGGSNWLELATDSRSLVGIQTDGSLWNIYSESMTNDALNLPPVFYPERIGVDTNWKSVAAGAGHFIALKTDGSLWGWGQNDSGQLGPGPMLFTNGVKRIGKDSNWQKVFASQNTSVGVKRDGSIWKWGFSITSKGLLKQQEPVRLNIEGENLRGYLNLRGYDLLLEEDGSLWTSGYLPLGLDYDYDHVSHVNSTTELWFRVRNASNWSAIGHHSDALTVLKRDGCIVQFNLYPLLFWRKVRPSKHCDWIAFSNTAWGQSLALASDGTLCEWRLGQPALEEGLLGPTRKPVWSVNIFKGSPQEN